MDGNPDTSRSLGCFSVSPTSAGVSSWCVSSSQAPLRGSSSSSVLFLGPVHRLVPFPPVVFCTDAAVVQKTHPSELCLFSLPPSLSAALGLAASQRWHQPFYCSLSLSLSLSPYTSCPSLPLYLKAPPPHPLFLPLHTLCLLYLYLYSLYPWMLLMAESQKHKLIIKASYSSIRDVCLPVHWSIREGSLTVWVNILDFLKIIKKIFWIMIF